MIVDSLGLLPLPERWRDSALCSEVDPELFFAGVGDASQVLDAKRICNMCPVIAPCRAEALENAEPHGVWGGLSAGERHNILRNRRFV